MTAARAFGVWRRVAPDGASAIVLVLALVGLVFAVPPVVRWALLDATFTGATTSACSERGACWPFVVERLPQFLYGYYPAPERWRLHVIGASLLAWCALLVVPVLRRSIAFALGGPAALLALGYVLASGGVFGLPSIEASQWGGLFVTLLLSFSAMVVALPAGIALALAREAHNPVLRGIASAFVEIIRGVPLLAILFMAVVLLPLFLPWQGGIGLFPRVVVGLCLYASAYMAEALRGALKSIPQGQFDAAAAMGLRYAPAMGLVILPQVLRRALPNVINIFIQILKDTTLVLIVGVYDLLGMVQLVVSDPKTTGYAIEAFVFAGLVFFVICFTISRLSLRIERLLGAGERRAP